MPKLTPEAPVNIPSEPEDTFPTITEQDLLDPSGEIYGVDTTPPTEELGGTADLASTEVISKSSPFYADYLEGKKEGEKAKKDAEGKPL